MNLQNLLELEYKAHWNIKIGQKQVRTKEIRTKDPFVQMIPMSDSLVQNIP